MNLELRSESHVNKFWCERDKKKLFLTSFFLALADWGAGLTTTSKIIFKKWVLLEAAHK